MREKQFPQDLEKAFPDGRASGRRQVTG
jgi:hypothetical protein